MKQNELDPVKVRQQGVEALVQALGPVGMVRFLQQFETGSGDYTRDRAQLLSGVSLEEVMAQIEQSRQHDRPHPNSDRTIEPI